MTRNHTEVVLSLEQMRLSAQLIEEALNLVPHKYEHQERVLLSVCKAMRDAVRDLEQENAKRSTRVTYRP